MLLLLGIALVFGVFLLGRSPRLESSAGRDAAKTVRAYVDGKPVHSYVKE